MARGCHFPSRSSLPAVMPLPCVLRAQLWAWLLVTSPGRCPGAFKTSFSTFCLPLGQHDTWRWRQADTWASGRRASNAAPHLTAGRGGLSEWTAVDSKYLAAHGVVWFNFLCVVTYIIPYLLNPLSRQQ